MINIIGQFFGTSGYAKHTRYLANALNELEEVGLMTNLPPNWERDVNDKELEMIRNSAKESYDTNLIITHPAHWRGNCWAKKNIVYLVWEGDSVPQWILEECMNENIHKIIVPSTHTAEALENTLHNHMFHTADEILDKVALIHHGVDIKIFKPLKIIRRQDKTTFNKPFKFLANKGFTNLEDRGGIQYLIRAFAEEFKPEENVELVLKINTAYGIPDIPKMFPDLKKTAPIRVIPSNLTNEQLNQLYNECDVFVSPTRSEAFNIPCLEAMACGKPVITTNFGGQTDFVEDKEHGWLIQSTPTLVEHDLEYEGIQWATPDHEHLKKLLRDAYKDKIHCISYGVHSYRDAKKYTWKNTAERVHKLCIDNRNI